MAKKTGINIDWFNSLGVKDKALVRDMFIKQTGISYPAWYYKIRYNSFNVLERKEFENICKYLKYKKKLEL